MYKILLVDDDIGILKMIDIFLQQKYQVKKAINSKTALKFLDEFNPDLLIIDWMLPDISGINLITIIKDNIDYQKYNNIPIIMLTAKGSESDKIKGFRVGADDYLVKPFFLSELEMRITSLLKRSNKNSNGILKVGNLTINTFSHQLFIDKKNISITIKEFNLLQLLMQDINKVYSRESLLNILWPNQEIESRTIDVCVARLRRSLKNHNCNMLKTVHKVGYKLVEKNE